MPILEFNNLQFGRQNVFGTTDGTVPTTNPNGFWQLGDMIVNLAGTIGTPTSWICTSAGTTPTFTAAATLGGAATVRSSATATTLLATDRWLFITAAAALTLPAPSAAMGTHSYEIKASAGPVTMTPASGNLDGSTSAQTLQAQQSVELFTDSVNWFTYGKYAPFQIRTATVPSTLSVTDKYVFSPAGALTIPAASTWTVGYPFYVKATASSVTITPASGTIDGAAAVTLTSNQVKGIIGDGTNFFLISN